jgi:hypothetical protein
MQIDPGRIIMVSRQCIRVLSVALLVAGAISLTATGARADSDPAKEVATAATHAGLAAKSTDMKMTQMHLHHVVNCLVGPKGEGFDANEANPCKDQGAGAIPDAKDAAQAASLKQALARANAGLGAKDMATAQANATAAQGFLTPKM